MGVASALPSSSERRTAARVRNRAEPLATPSGSAPLAADLPAPAGHRSATP